MADNLDNDLLRAQRLAAKLEADRAAAARRKTVSQHRAHEAEHTPAHTPDAYEADSARLKSASLFVLLAGVAIVLVIVATVFLSRSGASGQESATVYQTLPSVPAANLTPPAQIATDPSVPDTPTPTSSTVPASDAPADTASAPLAPSADAAPLAPLADAVPPAAPVYGAETTPAAPVYGAETTPAAPSTAAPVPANTPAPPTSGTAGP